MRPFLHLAVVSVIGLSSGPAVGTAPQAASVSGIVVSAEGPPVAIRRAIVTLTGAEGEASLAAITGDDGRFEFRDLPAGLYTVTARKPAYLTTAFGATAPGRPGTRVAISVDGGVRDLRIALPKGAVITGLARDAVGAPAVGATVTALPVGGSPGAATYAREGFAATTDDRGVYRIFGLPPGRYVVAMTPHRYVREVQRMAAAVVDAELRALEGRRAGRPAPPEPTAALQPQVYAPLFYPGTPIASEATHIVLAMAESRDGVDFTVEPFGTSTVDGTVSATDGFPLRDVQLSLVPSGPTLPVINFDTTSANLGADGRFEYRNVTPGRYVLLARRSSSRGWGLADFLVRGEAHRSVAVVLRAPITVAGRVVVDAAQPAPSVDPAALSVALRTPEGSASVTLPDGTAVAGITPPSPSAPGADGTFAIRDVLPGVYVPAVSLTGQVGSTRWWLRSAMLDNRDLLDWPLALGPDATDVTGLVLTVTDRHSALTGRLATADGSPGSGYVVVVVPADRTLWRPGARRIRFARPATDGSYAFADLPAGDFVIAALTDLDPIDLHDMALLDQLVKVGVPVSMRDGATTTQNLAVKGR
jgi:hypothetical protein